MNKTSSLTVEPVVHILHILAEDNEYDLAYGFLRDYIGQDEITNEELMYVFETIVSAGSESDAKALLQAHPDVIEKFRTGFITDED